MSKFDTFYATWHENDPPLWIKSILMTLYYDVGYGDLPMSDLITLVLNEMKQPGYSIETAAANISGSFDNENLRSWLSSDPVRPGYCAEAYCIDGRMPLQHDPVHELIRMGLEYEIVRVARIIEEGTDENL